MNNKTTFFAVLFILAGFVSFSQTKVGTVDIDYILAQMPETKDVQANLEAYTKELDSSLQGKLTVYQDKLKIVQPKVEAMTEAEKKTASEELYEMETDIQKFRQNGSALLELRKNQLLAPLYQKIGQNIEIIAKEKSYTQILTFDGNHMAYFDRAHDISDAVLLKMGITPKQE